MNRWCSWAVAATVLVVLRADARACDPVGEFPHTVDPSMQATDQTPPALPAIPPPTIHFAADDSFPGDGCGGSKCGDVSYIGIAALATDDRTAPDRIGYQLLVVNGSLPADVSLPATAIEPFLDQVRLYISRDTKLLDFTLQVAAIDLAGNASAPQTVHVQYREPASCSLGRGAGAGPTLGWIVVLALIAAARRRRRR